MPNLRGCKNPPGAQRGMACQLTGSFDPETPLPVSSGLLRVSSGLLQVLTGLLRVITGLFWVSSGLFRVSDEAEVSLIIVTATGM